MLRKRTNKRKAVKRSQPRISLPTIRMPAINWGLIGNTGLLAAVLCSTYLGTRWFLDQEIESVRIQGRFERVSAMQVESAITPYLNNGFLSVDLRTLQQAIAEADGIDLGSDARSLPCRFSTSVSSTPGSVGWVRSSTVRIGG